jgi:broad specificity phosphatase PhoE
VPPLLQVISHPEVRVDPAVPVPQWELSAQGLRRVRGLLRMPWVQDVSAVFSSAEPKALQTAELLAAACGHLEVVVHEGLGENDRSATGFLPPEQFEVVADLFFSAPTLSAHGWESAQAAQQRVVSAVDDCLRQAPVGDVAVVAHGGVGTLLWCHLAGQPISRRHDQPGQGSYYSIDIATRRPLSGWQRLPLPA